MELCYTSCTVTSARSGELCRKEREASGQLTLSAKTVPQDVDVTRRRVTPISMFYFLFSIFCFLMGFETDWSLLFALPHAVCGIPLLPINFGLFRYEVGIWV